MNMGEDSGRSLDFDASIAFIASAITFLDLVIPVWSTIVIWGGDLYLIILQHSSRILTR